ncbi:hypothetical protein MRI28_17480 [Nocardiopsis dassonvillei]|uniref:hypothetical protein n=1 Tax=Nocardiopsis dassonvillei TaxID=2014 RepID=UPI00200F5A4A|nr:hypothetical protein [Nocardiopsis dassonvillei]MCK9871408.1 hypothetical protein [Nocardiopsis dassonvillei]
MTRHVVQYSGGIASWATAAEVISRYGPGCVSLLFADTLVEDPDLYRFLADTTRAFGVPLITVKDGRTPFDVFRDQRFLGNSRLAPCSYWLKQRPCRVWLEKHADVDDTVVHVGISHQERARIPGIVRGWSPWRLAFDLLDRSDLTTESMLRLARGQGLTTPAMYDDGFTHNNCGGVCVRGGHRHWQRLLQVHPERYAQAERNEEQLRKELGDVSILKDRRGGQTRPLTLRAFRERQHS